MEVKGASLDDLNQIAAHVGVCFKLTRTRGNFIVGRLLPAERQDSEPKFYRYQRRSTSAFHSGRKVHAVCWHGYRDFLFLLFELRPTAKVKTAFEQYNGRAEFLAKFRATGYRNIGSQAFPEMACGACFCSDFGDDCEPSELRMAEAV